MAARRPFLIALGVLVGLPALALLLRVTGIVSPVRHSPPRPIDTAALRAEIAAKRARGESIAVRTIETAEWETQEPGIEVVVRGDAMSGVVDVELERAGVTEKLGQLGGMGLHRLHAEPKPGLYTCRVIMGGGSRSASVRVEEHQLTRVVVTLTHVRTERKSMRTMVSEYDAGIVVEPPHPAGRL